MQLSYLVIVLVVSVGFFLYRKKQLAAAQETYARFQIGPLAQSLGLRVVHGDPTANLMLAPHNTQGTRIADDQPYEWHVRLQGEPRGRPVEVLYFHRRERKTGVVEVTFTYYDEAYVAVALRGAVPDFEVVSKKSSLGAIDRKQALPPRPFGDPELDQEFTLATNDPNVGRKLRRGLLAFDPGLRGYGVHLDCREGCLRFRAGRNHVSGVMYFVDSIIPTLEGMAAELESGA